MPTDKSGPILPYAEAYFIAFDQLQQLLGFKWSEGEQLESSQLGKDLLNIQAKHNKNDTLLRDRDLSRLFLLCDHLHFIKEKDPVMFKRAVKGLRNSEKQITYYGMRFEVTIFALLCYDEYTFEWKDRPDFIIRNPDCFLECTSVRSTKSKVDKEEICKKVLDKIQEKKSKPYANDRTCLVIDITNVVFHSVFNKLIQDELVSYVKENVGELRYGFVILFHTRLIKGSYTTSFEWVSIAGGNPDHNLVTFINAFFPNTRMYYPPGSGMIVSEG